MAALAALRPILERLEVVCAKLDAEIAKLNQPFLADLKRRTGMRYSHLLLGLLMVSFAFLFLGLGAAVFVWCVSWLYPAYASFKAIESSGGSDDKQWLTYWIVLGIVNLIDGVVDSVLSWVPLWWSAKVLFLVWLQLPQFRGAEFLYNSFLRPLFIKHSPAIEARFMAVKDVSSNLAKAAGIDLNALAAAGNNSNGGAASSAGGDAGHDAELAPSQVFGASSSASSGNGVVHRKDR